MIGYLKGAVIHVSQDEIVVDVIGVGYKVSVPQTYKRGQKVELFVHTYVREDTISLFGFRNSEELNLFDLLISVSGVGPKVAMLVLKNASTDKIQNAISKADVSFFTSIPGIGKKGAQKIIIELRGKMGSLADIDLADDRDDDMVNGLVAMGFTKKEAHKALSGIDSTLNDSQKLKAALTKLSSVKSNEKK